MTALGAAFDDLTVPYFASNFGFSIPAAATINGWVFEIKRDGDAVDEEVYAYGDFGPHGDNQSAGQSWSLNPTGYVIFGGPGILWGLTPSPADINNPNFGIYFRARCGGGGDPTVDHFRITVYYTMAGAVATQRRRSEKGFPMLLRQSTAVTIKSRKFVDSIDGFTAETGLTINQSDILLSKNGGALAQKNSATAGVHDSGGHYDIALNAPDTGTLGRLTLAIAVAGAFPVEMEFMVVTQARYDALVETGNFESVLAVGERSTLYAGIAATPLILHADYVLAKTAAQPGSAMTLTEPERTAIAGVVAITPLILHTDYNPAKTAAAPGAAMTLTGAYDLAKTAAQVGAAMTLSVAYERAKNAASWAEVQALEVAGGGSGLTEENIADIVEAIAETPLILHADYDAAKGGAGELPEGSQVIDQDELTAALIDLGKGFAGGTPIHIAQTRPVFNFLESLRS